MGTLLPWYAMDDSIYPFDNAFEIPTLDITMQASGVIGNFYIWGNNRQTPRIGHTYGFYCADSKFTALIKHPEGILKSQCAAIVEPNFSTSSRMRLPVALYGIYQKRKIAYYVQSKGVKVIADLTIHPKFAELNLLGIPAGWQSYAIRATRTFGNEFILNNWERAKQHSGNNKPGFFVYGGGKAIQQLCHDYHWDWEPEHMNKIKNRIHT